MGVPVEIVIDGVIDSAAIFTAEAEIQNGKAEEILERSVVGTAARNSYAQVAALAQLLAIIVVGGSVEAMKLPAFPNGKLSFRVLYLAGNVIHQPFQSVRALRVKETASIGVGIDVHNGFFAKVIRVCFGPLGGT